MKQNIFLRRVSSFPSPMTEVVQGLRCVVPYYYVFSVFAKGRWVGRSLLDVMSSEFTMHSIEYYVRIIHCTK